MELWRERAAVHRAMPQVSLGAGGEDRISRQQQQRSILGKYPKIYIWLWIFLPVSRSSKGISESMVLWGERTRAMPQVSWGVVGQNQQAAGWWWRRRTVVISACSRKATTCKPITWPTENPFTLYGPTWSVKAGLLEKKNKSCMSPGTL